MAKKRPYDQLIDQLMMTAGPASSADQAVSAARQRINQNRSGKTVAGRPASSVGVPQMTSTAGSPASRISVPRGGAGAAIPPVASGPSLGNQLMPGLGPMGALPPGANPNWAPGGVPQGPAGGTPIDAPALPPGRVQATYTPPVRPAPMELPASSAAAGPTMSRGAAGAAKAASSAAGTAGVAARPMAAGAASLADDVAAIAGLGGGGGGAASAAGAVAPATGLARLTGGLGGRAIAGRLGLGAGAGLLASQLVPDVDDTSTDSGVRGALTGAGLGASVGSIVPGLGTAIGGLAGAGIGGLIGMFGPKGDASGANAVAEALQQNSAKLDQALAQFQLDPQSQQALQAQLVPLLLNAGSREQVDAAFTQVAAQLPAIIQQDQVYKEQARAEQERAVRAAAMQSLLAPAMQQWASQADTYAQQAAAAQRSAADQLQDPTLAAVFRNQAAQLPLNTAQQNQSAIRQLALADAAYAQQAQLMREQQQQAAVPSTNDLIAQLLGQ